MSAPKSVFVAEPAAWQNWPREVVAKACKQFGVLLEPELKGLKAFGEPIKGENLLWAIAGCESTWGDNCKPRFESAYWIGGMYAVQSKTQKDLNVRWPLGQAAHSYSPWQILPCNALGFSPQELGTDVESAALAVTGFLRRYVLGVRKAITLEEILDTYNSGTWRDAVTIPVQRYIDKGVHIYTTEVLG